MATHPSVRVFVIALAACLVCNAPAHGQATPAAPSPAYVAEMKISVVYKGKATTGDVVEDLVGTHAAILMNQITVEHAVKVGNLGRLKSLTGDDPAKKILAGLTVLPDTAAPTSVIALTYRGTDAGDCLEILGALVKAHGQYVEDNGSRDMVRRLTVHNEILKQDLRAARDRYNEFVSKRGPLDAKGEYDLRKAMILALGQKKTALLIRQAELEASLKSLDGITGDTRTAALLKAADWATWSGYDRLPKEVTDKTSPLQAYTAALRGDLDENLQVMTRMDALQKKEMAEAGARFRGEQEEEDIRKEIARLEKFYDVTLDRLKTLEFSRDSKGLEVRIVAPAVVRKLS